ncbi:MAG: hypothetical protein EAZ30_11510 [Betaproteobacteria bacterium]|nr:MAG: hypothetical protein EAZ30_11510 [Betaproteobacteria bacterium]
MNDLSLDSAVDGVCLSALPMETFGLAPHPDNHRFARQTVAQMLYHVGCELPNIGVDPDAGFAAAWTARYFVTRQGDALVSATTDDMILLPAIDAAEHAMFLRDTTPPDEPTLCCTVSANLRALQRLLHLSDFERSMLQWAYALVGAHDTLPSKVLSHLVFRDEAHRHRMIAALFGVSVKTVESYFTSINRLLALGFLAPNEFQIKQCLADVLVATDSLVRVLETPIRSDDGLVAMLLEHEADSELLTDEDDSRTTLFETYPGDIADCYERALRNQAMRVHDVHALVEWFTGIEFHRECFDDFGKCFAFETVRETIKRCALERSRAGLPTRPFDVIRALYVAAK